MLDLLFTLADMGAAFYSNVSGGKDGQAMTAILAKFFPITGLVHADLGSIEWKESLPMCERLAEEFGVPLHVVKRTDGRSMVDHWWRCWLEQLRRFPYWLHGRRTILKTTV